MYTYSTSNYSLSFSDDFKTLEVKENSTGNTTPYNLENDHYRVDVVNQEYRIQHQASVNCYTEDFDPADIGTPTFDATRLWGVTLVRIEDIRVVHSFEIGVGPVYLHFDTGKLAISAPANSDGSGYDPDVVTRTEEDL